MEGTTQESKSKKYVNQQLATLREQNQILKRSIKDVQAHFASLNKKIYKLEKELEELREYKKNKQKN